MYIFSILFNLFLYITVNIIANPFYFIFLTFNQSKVVHKKTACIKENCKKTVVDGCRAARSPLVYIKLLRYIYIRSNLEV